VKLLVLEDDPDTADYLNRGLSEAGHVVDLCRDGRDAFNLACDGGYDVLIIDRMVPGMDGLRTVKSLRAADTRTPILFLTAVNGVRDRVEGLEAGADDYLVKPFAFTELLARINALARRPPISEVQTVLRADDLELDRLRRTVTRGGRRLDLKPQEFKLLEYLLERAGQVVTRTMLLEKVWSFHFDPKTNIVESHMSRLRAKVDRGFERPLIETVRGAGYRIHACD
jgi:two-component system OmpR family response regulator